MKKFNLKQLAILCLIVLLNFNIAFAVDTDNIYNYFATGAAQPLDFTNITNIIFGIIVWGGYALALCIVIITGIQFLIASPQKKAQLKEKLWLIAIGVIILVAGASIINIIANIISGAASTL